MLVKNFKERKSIAGMKSTPKDTIFNIYTEIKNKRQELDGLIDVLTQYEERNNSLCLEITARTNELAEIENLIDLANSERIDLNRIEAKQPLKFTVDVINWRKNKFKDPLKNLKMPEKSVKFLVTKNQVSVIEGFQKRFNTYKDKDFYNAAMDFVQPRKYLLHNLSYED